MRRLFVVVMGAALVSGAALGGTICSSASAPFDIDTGVPLVDPQPICISYDASWIGGDANATVVIADNGTEVRRTTGAGEFTYAPPGIGRHELTYTTYIGGVLQNEVYTNTVYAQWKYDVKDGGAIITETTQKSGSVTIPAEIDGYTVTGIASGAFKDCTGISSVSIPESVTRIEDGTFEGCTGIVTVNVPMLSWKVVPGFYEALFEGLESFDTTLSIFDAPVSIKLSAEKLESSIAHQEMCCYGSYMYFCGGKTYYFSAVYDDHAALKVDSSWVIEPQRTLHEKRTGSISFGESGWHWIEVIAYNIDGPGGIEDDGFRWWTSDDSTKHQFVDRGDGMLFKTDMSVGTIARIFPDSYDSLRVAKIVGDVSAIANGFFEGCAGLTEIQIPSTVTNIGASAFAGCVGLTAVDIPSGVTSIGSAAFASCSNLTEVVIPDSVWDVGAGAFANCTGLRRVEAAKGLKGTLEAQNVFEGCPANLEIVYVETATISNVTAKQRYPWNGKVDITYTLAGDVTVGFQPDAEIAALISASNRLDGTTCTATASALSGDTGTAEGVHHVIWDLNAQGLEINSDEMVFSVAYVPVMRYCVVDLAGGASASSYPVSYLANVPSGGWTDEYKTTKLVLRRIEPGTFMMGGSYQVTLTKPFYCGVFEVTQKGPSAIAFKSRA